MTHNFGPEQEGRWDEDDIVKREMILHYEDQAMSLDLTVSCEGRGYHPPPTHTHMLSGVSTQVLVLVSFIISSPMGDISVKV